MASALDTVATQTVSEEAPVYAPMSFENWLSDQNKNAGLWPGYRSNWAKFWSEAGLRHKKDREEYQDYIDKYKTKYNQQVSEYSENSARQFNQEMAETNYQRAYEDILKTGLNPRLLLEHLSGSEVSPGQSAMNFSASNNSSYSSTSSSSSTFSSSALIGALLAIVIKVLLA